MEYRIEYRFRAEEIEAVRDLLAKIMAKCQSGLAESPEWPSIRALLVKVTADLLGGMKYASPSLAQWVKCYEDMGEVDAAPIPFKQGVSEHALAQLSEGVLFCDGSELDLEPVQWDLRLSGEIDWEGDLRVILRDAYLRGFQRARLMHQVEEHDHECGGLVNSFEYCRKCLYFQEKPPECLHPDSGITPTGVDLIQAQPNLRAGWECSYRHLMDSPLKPTVGPEGDPPRLCSMCGAPVNFWSQTWHGFEGAESEWGTFALVLQDGDFIGADNPRIMGFEDFETEATILLCPDHLFKALAFLGVADSVVEGIREKLSRGAGS